MLEPEDFYLENGLMVFTEHFHRKRGSCCGNNCRHCPYDRVAVNPAAKNAPRVSASRAQVLDAACPGCGTRYHCGVNDESCWCGDVPVSPAALGEIRAGIPEAACLCRSCLGSVAGR